MAKSQFNINQNNFDFIRFMLAFIVVLGHITNLIPNSIYDDIKPFFKSEIAIRGFFIISGFLVAKSLENTSSNSKYFIKRIRRIVPAYTFVIIFFALLLSTMSTASLPTYFGSAQFWNYLVVNLIYQNYLQPCLPGVFEVTNVDCAVNGALWTIKIEEGFYLILPIIVYFNKIYLTNKWIYYGLIYISSLVFFNYFSLTDNYRIAKQLPGAMAYFSSGIIAYYNFHKILPFLSKLIIPAVILFICEYNFLPIIIFRPLTLCITLLYLAYNFKFLNNFGKHGDFTYGVYIFHYPLIQIFVNLTLHEYFNRWYSLIFLLAVTLLCSVFSWKVIESRFISRSYIHRIHHLEKN